MKVSRRSAAISTLVGNGLTVGITVAQAFLLMPLALVQLGPGLYGPWLAAVELLLWIQLLDAGIPNLLMQRVGAAVGRNDLGDAARWSSTAILMVLVLATLLGATGVAVASWVGSWLSVPSAHLDRFAACFRIGVVASAMLMCSNTMVGLARGVQRTATINVAQVAGSVGGLLVAIVLLAGGWGLWALPAGMVVRAVVSLCGALWFFLRDLPRGGGSWWASPSRTVAAEVARMTPALATGSAGYVLAANSEVLLVTSIFGPVPALAYTLTRRAFDGVRNLLDTIAWAASGGFAHLVTADDNHRARGVFHEVLWWRLAMGSVCAAVVMAVNRPFVTLLFGAEHYGGLLLTVGFAFHMILGGQSFLANFLWRSIGRVREGSLWLGAETILRLGAIAGALALFGLAGGPLAGAAVSAASLVLLSRRVLVSLPHALDTAGARAPRLTGPLLVFVGGLAFAGLDRVTTWPSLAIVAAVIALAGAAVIWSTLPAQLKRGALLRWKNA